MARYTKYWKKRLGKIEYNSPYQDHLNLIGITELNDSGLAYFLKNLKGINMLDLNETEITNESILALSNLEYVNELRIKGCTDIDNSCITSLNKITSLKFLHIKDTNITIDGILQLHALTELATLLFSDDFNEVTNDKMMELKQMFPKCSFIVNSIPYVF